MDEFKYIIHKDYKIYDYIKNYKYDKINQKSPDYKIKNGSTHEELVRVVLENYARKKQQLENLQYEMNQNNELLRAKDRENLVLQQEVNHLRKQIESLRQETYAKEDPNECKICMANKINCALQCGHLVCMSCANDVRVTHCPICRTEIRSKLQIYL